MILTAVIYGAVAMFAFGVANAFLKAPAAQIGVIESILVRNLAAVPVLAVAWVLISGAAIPQLSFSAVLGGVAIAILGYLPFLFFLQALNVGEVGRVIPLTAVVRIVVSVLFGVIIWADALSFFDLAALVAVLIGVFLVTYEFRSGHITPIKSWVVPAFGASVLWGFLYPLFGYYAGLYGAFFYSLCIEVAVLGGAYLHLVLKKKQFSLPLTTYIADRRTLWWLVVAGVLTAVGTLSFNVGYGTGEIGIVSAIGGSSAVVSTICAMFLYRERVSLVQWFGIFAAMAAIVLFSIQ